MKYHEFVFEKVETHHLFSGETFMCDKKNMGLLFRRHLFIVLSSCTCDLLSLVSQVLSRLCMNCVCSCFCCYGRRQLLLN